MSPTLALANILASYSAPVSRNSAGSGDNTTAPHRQLGRATAIELCCARGTRARHPSLRTLRYRVPVFQRSTYLAGRFAAADHGSAM